MGFVHDRSIGHHVDISSGRIAYVETGSALTLSIISCAIRELSNELK